MNYTFQDEKVDKQQLKAGFGEFFHEDDVGEQIEAEKETQKDSEGDNVEQTDEESNNDV